MILIMILKSFLLERTVGMTLNHLKMRDMTKMLLTAGIQEY
jgi:hypothetical protein